MSEKIQDPAHFDVAVVAAHPDDAEIGVGGTMARLADEGYSVLLINLTDGEPTPLGTRELRLQEAARAAEILNIERVTMELPNRRLFDTFEARVALGDLFRKHTPNLVIGMKGKTVMASPDHFQAQLITEAAVFYSRLSKWPEHFQYPVHPIKQLLYFPLRQRNEEPAGFPFAVDISSTLERKIEAIRAYASQFPPDKQAFLHRIASWNEYCGSLNGVGAAEVLELPRMPLLSPADLFRA